MFKSVPSKSPPQGLIISPYHAQSHANWVKQLQRILSFIEWRVLTLSPRFFNWRVRGNPLALLYEGDNIRLFQGLDLMIATSMTDLATLRGLMPSLHDVPTAIYFHENQFAYPSQDRNSETRLLEAKMVSLYSALSGETVVFNSEFNRATFLDGARQMLSDFPDHAPLSCVDLIAEKSVVIPVPLSDALASVAPPMSGSGTTVGRRPLAVAWNHRWEHDKGPDRLVKVLELVKQRSLDCQFFIFGQQFRVIPPALRQLTAAFKNQIAHLGYIADERAYYRKLAQCDVVLSTALHDFQGLAVLEALRLGCIPLVPDRLAYREFIPSQYRFPSMIDDLQAECECVVERLAVYQRLLTQSQLPQTPAIPQLEDSVLRVKYEALINRLLAYSRPIGDSDTI